MAFSGSQTTALTTYALTGRPQVFAAKTEAAVIEGGVHARSGESGWSGMGADPGRPEGWGWRWLPTWPIETGWGR